MNVYLGIDIGSISTKGVVIKENNEIINSSYIETNGNPIQAVKKLISNLKMNNVVIKGIGVTGSARKLIGLMLNANVIKNEITAHTIGTLSKIPNVKTILEIGGQDSKIIILNNGIITDYAMNTLCAAGTGAFLTSQAKRLNIDVEKFGSIALQSTSPVKIAARCTVFAESDLVHKAQLGYEQKDIVAGLCKSIVLNYLNNLAKGKKIEEPIVFQGGVSKNKGVVKYFKEVLGKNVIVLEESHLMGALGIAIMSKKSNSIHSWDINEIDFKTIGKECKGCSNECEVLKIYKNNELIDTYGNKCDNFFKVNN